MAPCLFQSLLDFALSILLLLTTWTMAEPGVDEGSRAEGVLGWMECHLWKTEFLLWGLNVSSTWNIVTLTIERFVTACKRSLRRLCFHRCLSLHRGWTCEAEGGVLDRRRGGGVRGRGTCMAGDMYAGRVHG